MNGKWFRYADDDNDDYDYGWWYRCGALVVMVSVGNHKMLPTLSPLAHNTAQLPNEN